MILIVGKDNKIKDVIEETKFSELGIWERKHVEEWILKYPEILGEDLLIVTTEYDRFDKTKDRLDILAIDKNGKLVVIELKRDVADRFADLQAIHYAAYCSNINLEQIIDMMADYKRKKHEKDVSKEEIQNDIIEFIANPDFSEFDNKPRIILVANDFREETLSAVLWLRDNGIDITCIKLEPYKIGENIVIKPEIIVPLPEAKNYIVQVEQKKKTTSELTKRQKEYYEFWSKLLEEFKRVKPDVTRRSATKDSWLGLPAGYRYIHFEWYFRRRPTEGFYVALHFEHPKYEDNKKMIEYFFSKKEELEKKFPEDELIFEKRWGSKWAQIYVKRDSGNFDEENLKWGKERMAKFYDVFKPLLDEFFKRK